MYLLYFSEALYFCIYILTFQPEFTEHQRAVFCVFSSDGVNGLRSHLNHLDRQPSYDTQDDFSNPGNLATNGAQPMTGILPTTIQGADDGADADDEELDDADGSPGIPGPQW